MDPHASHVQYLLIFISASSRPNQSICKCVSFSSRFTLLLSSHSLTNHIFTQHVSPSCSPPVLLQSRRINKSCMSQSPAATAGTELLSKTSSALLLFYHPLLFLLLPFVTFHLLRLACVLKNKGVNSCIKRQRVNKGLKAAWSRCLLFQLANAQLSHQ